MNTRPNHWDNSGVQADDEVIIAPGKIATFNLIKMVGPSQGSFSVVGCKENAFAFVVRTRDKERERERERDSGGRHHSQQRARERDPPTFVCHWLGKLAGRRGGGSVFRLSLVAPEPGPRYPSQVP